MKKSVFVFPNSDFKFKCWSASLPEELFVASSGPYWNFLLLILQMRFRYERVVVFYRYLNVSRGMVHEMAKLILDVIILFLAALKLIEIRWIVHNVDQESETRYYFITFFKRVMLSHVATNYYVTSDSLIQYFPYAQSKLRVISFGKEYHSYSNAKETRKLIKLINDWKVGLEKTPTYIGIVTNWANKHSGVLNLIDFVLKSDSQQSIGLIYLGTKTNIESEYFLEINDRYDYFLSDINVDFVFKTLSDKSIPYTLYSAATAGIPLISSSHSYFSKDLLKYGLGGCIDSCEDIIPIIEDYDTSNAESFLKNHTWMNGAKSLVL